MHDKLQSVDLALSCGATLVSRPGRIEGIGYSKAESVTMQIAPVLITHTVCPHYPVIIPRMEQVIGRKRHSPVTDTFLHIDIGVEHGHGIPCA